jgi:hypothetical protein
MDLNQIMLEVGEYMGFIWLRIGTSSGLITIMNLQVPKWAGIS